jgi:hypothetical protein
MSERILVCCICGSLIVEMVGSDLHEVKTDLYKSIRRLPVSCSSCDIKNALKENLKRKENE